MNFRVLAASAQAPQRSNGNDFPPHNAPRPEKGGCTMEDAETGSQLHPVSVPEVGEDAVTSVGPSPPPPGMTEEEQQELQEELVKRQLGITPLNELKQNFTKTWQDVTTSVAYKRTSETLSQAGLKATAAFSNMGSAITRKLEDVRNAAPTFKSFEEKVETLKTKISPPASSSSQGEQEGPSNESLLTVPEGSPPQETPMN
ncbi:hypothetical protein F7725_025112 [Dissostichus mawsoni]|uniref:Tumor protein D52 n=1 Tax=Dissostichus mawsoni TaxID=36200 RepID=A0A7J5XC46_DISMA|nr:hypothetical protein F7725_025112 [Dissostichus mawsoni]